MPLLKPKDFGIIIATSDVIDYDGSSLSNISIGTSASLNDVILAIDNTFAGLPGASDPGDATYNGSSPTCLALTGTRDDVILQLGNAICSNQTTIAALGADDIAWSGGNFTNFTETGSSGLQGVIEGIDNQFGIISGTTGITEAQLAANLDELIFADFNSAGGTSTTSPATLSVTISSGTYFINGLKVDAGGFGATLSASQDHYIYVDNIGAYNLISQTLGAGEPGAIPNSIQLYKWITDGTGVTTEEDRRNPYAYSGAQIRDDSILTRHIAVGNITGTELEDVITPANIDFANIIVDANGRVTTVTSDVTITSISTDDLLQWSGSAFVNVPIFGNILPSSTSGQTMRSTGTAWEASSNIFNNVTKTGIGGTVAPIFTLSLNVAADFGVEMATPTTFAGVDITGGSLAADTYFYRVVALDALNQESPAASEVTVITAATGQNRMTWDRINGAFAYRLYRSLTSLVYTSGYLLVPRSPSSTITFDDDGTVSLTPGSLLTPTLKEARTVGIDILGNLFHNASFISGGEVRITNRVDVNSTTHTVDTEQTYISVLHTATAAVAITLTDSTTTVNDGMIVIIKDSGYNAGTFNITISASGSDTVENGASLVMSTNGASVILRLNSSTADWEKIN